MKNQTGFAKLGAYGVIAGAAKFKTKLFKVKKNFKSV